MDTKRFASAARLVLGFALIGVLIFGAVAPASAAAVTHYVDASASGLNDGSSWANAYRGLQDALAHVVSGDRIWVAGGIYFPTDGDDRSQTFTLQSGVEVYGGFAGTETLLSQRDVIANPTILSGDLVTKAYFGDNSYHVVSGGTSDSTAILDGFTIMAGYADGTDPNNRGAGMYNSASPTLRNLTFTGNMAPTTGYGGGMYNGGGGAPSLVNVLFSGNHAGSIGGGMWNNASSPTLTNVTFGDNTSNSYGGGMSNWYGANPSLTGVIFLRNRGNSGGGMDNYNSDPVLTNVDFVANTAQNGGGMYNDHSTPALTNVTFTTNWASYGGGMSNAMSDPGLTNVSFVANWASIVGGAMWNMSASNAVLTNVTFGGNAAATYGGGIYNDGSSPTLTNATLSRNAASTDGGGMYSTNSSAPIIKDAIFWGNEEEVVNSSSTPTITDSIVRGSSSGCPGTCTNVLDADPKLGPLQNNGGLTKTMALGAGSAAIDAGGVTTTCASKDQRGVTRPQGGKCDIGAYEVKALQVRSAGANDGWVLESTETSKVGGSLNSIASTLRLGDDASNRQYRGVLSFNTASVPDTASVVVAQVKLKHFSFTGPNPFPNFGTLTLDVKRPYFGTVAALEIGDFQAASTALNGGTVGSTGVEGWYIGPLNSAGRAAVNRTGTTQIRLRFALDDDNDHTAEYVSIYSGNGTYVQHRPLLIVYYNP